MSLADRVKLGCTMNVQNVSQIRLPMGALILLSLLFAFPAMAADNGLTILSVSDGDTQQEFSVTHHCRISHFTPSIGPATKSS